MFYINFLKNDKQKVKTSKLFFLLKLFSFNEDFTLIFFKLKKVKLSFLYIFFFLKTFCVRVNIQISTIFLLNYKQLQINAVKKYKNSTNFIKTVSFIKEFLTNPIYKPANLNTHVDVQNKQIEFHFLRKNKVFNKGRYSRCRQNYRTGVYLCMYLSIISIFGLYFWFLKFSFNFSYLWWFFILFVGSFFLPKTIKYRLYTPQGLFKSFSATLNWVYFLVKSVF